MPLRDHFHPPLSLRHTWDELHGGWPMKIVEQLSKQLPSQYLAAPQVHLGGAVEIDVGTFEYDTNPSGWNTDESAGGLATATWRATEPQLDVEVNIPEPDEYSVRIYDVTRERKLVASIELVSPANKDRPESRQNFISKCAALLLENVSVVIVDVVTSREFNIYAELIRYIGQPEPKSTAPNTSIYVAACRTLPKRQHQRLQAWYKPLSVGQVLPTVPLWLSADLAIDLELELSYEESCRILRM